MTSTETLRRTVTHCTHTYSLYVAHSARPPERGAAVSTNSIFELAERYGDAWHSHDADAIVALHTDDTVFHMHVGDEPARGREAVRETFAQILEQWPDLHFEAVTMRF